jgi:hypothetical protein
MCPNTMTITTYDLTFSNFFIYLLLRQCGNKFHNICMLLATDVVKIHDIVWIKLPTVSTRRFFFKVSDICSQMSLLLGYRELFRLHRVEYHFILGNTYKSVSYSLIIAREFSSFPAFLIFQYIVHSNSLAHLYCLIFQHTFDYHRNHI